MMDSIKYSAVGIFALVIIIMLREYEGRFALFARMAFSVGASTVCIAMFSKIYEYISVKGSWISVSEEISDIFTVMLKMSGISFAGCICASICRDSGENGTATTVEMICKMEIILLCLPVIDMILNEIQSVIS